MINVTLCEFHFNFFSVEKKKETENKGKKGKTGVRGEGEKLLRGAKERNTHRGIKEMR